MTTARPGDDQSPGLFLWLQGSISLDQSTRLAIISDVSHNDTHSRAIHRSNQEQRTFVNTREYTLPYYEQVLEFLASGPSVEQIVAYRPPRAAQARFSRLLEANRTRSLNPNEEEELDH